MTCNLCALNELVNEVKAAGAEVYVAPPDEFGIDVYVIPSGEKPDFRIRRDGTCSPQRKLWVCELPDRCECDTHIKAKFELTWQPSANEEVVEEPVDEEPRERLSLV